MTVLVTGGAGFLGSHVARALAERGLGVVLYDAGAPTAELAHLLEPVRDRIRHVGGDIEDTMSLAIAMRESGADRMLHAAALVDARAYARQPFVLYRANVAGTLAVLEAARFSGVRRVVYVSSLAVIPAKRYEPIDEDHPLLDAAGRLPSNLYGASKAAAELLGLSYARELGLHFVILRLSALYGFGMRHAGYVKPMVEGAVRGERVRFGGGAELRRPFCNVKDAARACLLALETDLARLRHRVFNISAERAVTMREIAEAVRDVVPGAEIEIAEGLSDYERDDAERQGDVDISRARRELGFEPTFDMRRGIEDYVADYRHYLASR